jgi:Ca-activated chloride channel family protein
MNLNRSEQRKQRDGGHGPSRSLLPSVQIFAAFLLLCALAIGSWRNPDFWSTPDRRGDALLRDGKFSEAAKTYSDPWRIGVAQYRNGDFEAAATSFARVPGATGAFDQGNAWLMHGEYAAAISSYDRALGFRPGWKEAEDNKALAVARQAMIDDSEKDRDQEQGDTDPPDGEVSDEKGGNNKSQPVDLAASEVSDEELRASWLRRVQTTPGDFLKAKFAYQAAHVEQKEAKEGGTP